MPDEDSRLNSFGQPQFFIIVVPRIIKYAAKNVCTQATKNADKKYPNRPPMNTPIHLNKKTDFGSTASEPALSDGLKAPYTPLKAMRM